MWTGWLFGAVGASELIPLRGLDVGEASFQKSYFSNAKAARFCPKGAIGNSELELPCHRGSVFIHAQLHDLFSSHLHKLQPLGVGMIHAQWQRLVAAESITSL